MRPDEPAWKAWDDDALDPKDKRVIRTAMFIAVYWQRHRYGPTLREIQSEMGVASLTTIREDLAILSKQGLVTYIPKQARTLVPTDTLLAQI